MHLTNLSHNKDTYFSGFVTLFCYWVRFVVFTRKNSFEIQIRKHRLIIKSLWILKPKPIVNPTTCKFAVLSSVNNLSNLSGYFSFDHTSLQ